MENMQNEFTQDELPENVAHKDVPLNDPTPEDEIPADFDPTQPPAKFGYPLFMMTDRDLMEELVFQGRSLAGALAQFQNMGPADLVKSFLKPKG